MSMVQLYDLGHVVEPNAKSFYIVHIAGRDAVELLKDVLLVLLGNADAVVADAEFEKSVYNVCAHCDLGRLGRIFDAIVNEVVDEVGKV